MMKKLSENREIRATRETIATPHYIVIFVTTNPVVDSQNKSMVNNAQ